MVDYAAAKRMMKYLNGTRDVALELRPRKGPLHLDGALVSSLWQTQVLIAWSSPEAEYYACTVEVSEAKFVQSLLLEWGEPGEIEHVVDNSSAITLGRWIGLGGVRHMETRYMWIQEELMAQRLKLTKINGTENATEVATKHVDANNLAEVHDNHWTGQPHKVSRDGTHGLNRCFQQMCQGQISVVTHRGDAVRLGESDSETVVVLPATV